ncbi:hypothetical protein FYJ33_15265 [Clostridiaceae bacterium WCA-383-APC-5B]|uniref:Glycosyltransferase RgtA/B/C/D-like domain-containing protein n=2 Tax=Inconstantimicrobium porci TaxID=2652291 RepID=A0A7X2T2W9_9CLOT|nr:hypothetical protein [Inconstantimicrobium porci]
MCLVKGDRKCFFGISLVFIVIIQLLMMFKYEVKPSADFGVIFNQAVKLADIEGLNKIGSYFEMYPNNIPLLALMTLWLKLMKLLGVVNYKISAVILNIIFIDTAVTFFYLSSKRIFKNNDSIILVMMMIMFLPFYTYVGMFYTDTMSMPFIAIIVYLSTFIGDECTGYKNNYRKIILLVLLGVTACLGFKMKATVGILLIAFIIFEIIMKKNFKLKMINIGVALCSFIITGVIVGNCINLVLPINHKGQSEKSLPYTHWVMMGLGKSGYYNEEVFGNGAPLTYSKLSAVGFYDEKDVVETSKHNTYNDKIRFNLQEINAKICSYGVSGMAKHIVKKTICTWGDGTYYALLYLPTEKFTPAKIKVYRNISFAYHITLIFLFIVGLIGIIKKRKHNTDFIVYVSILGLVIFLSIWETSPRYVLNFMPLILFQASPAVGELCDKIKFRK